MKNKDSYDFTYFQLTVLLLVAVLVLTIPVFLVINKGKVTLSVVKDMNKDTIVSFINLTESEIDFAEGLILEMKPEYLVYTKEVIFTHDPSRACEDDGYECERVYGANLPNGKIIIGMNHENMIRNTLCHEVLHDFVETESNDRNDTGHDLIYKLAEQDVCY